MLTNYKECFEKELLFYYKIQETLDEQSTAAYEDLHLNPQIEGAYQCICELQHEQADCMRTLMKDECFREKNPIFIKFIEIILDVGSLSEIQKYDSYSLVYKLSEVEPGQQLLQQFIDNKNKNTAFKISLKSGEEPKAKEMAIYFPFQPNVAPLRLTGGMSKPLIPEVRHILFGHELIHIYLASENLCSSSRLNLFCKPPRLQSKQLLYCDPYSPNIDDIKLEEYLTIEGDITKLPTPKFYLVTENSLRRAFHLPERLGWHVAPLYNHSRIQDLLILLNSTHKNQPLYFDTFSRLTDPFSSPMGKLQTKVAAPSQKVQTAKNINELIYSFFLDPFKATQNTCSACFAKAPVRTVL